MDDHERKHALAAEYREKAAGYRKAAETARVADTIPMLINLAKRYEKRAADLEPLDNRPFSNRETAD